MDTRTSRSEMIALLTLLLAPRLVLAFNLEPRHAVVITDPSGDRDSYFGYALSFWQQTAPGGPLVNWLLVGAPKGNEPQLTGDRVRRPGVVYKCRVDTDNPLCYRIPVLGSEDKTQQDLRWRGQKNIPARGWLGGTIAVENKPDGAVAVCAPRMKEMRGPLVWHISGTCFYLQRGAEFTALTKLTKVYPYTELVKENGFVAGLAQVGMSAQFVQNASSSQLVAGCPGVYYFKGSVTVYGKNGTGKELNGLQTTTILNADRVRPDSFMGYSVTTARFHKDGRVSYVSGAPRAEGEELYTGAVFVQEGVGSKVWKLSGVQMGEYFGASVAAVDLEGDGRHDLLVVGAPLHSYREGKDDEAGGDHGKVYVYVNKGEARLERTEVSLMGSSVSWARFGSSIAVIGDLNRDGFNDIAVGAPYEGPGVVYIYHGHAGGLRSRFAQRISAYQIQHPLNPVRSAARPLSEVSGFGISIASGVDVDDNSFNDLAIGSHEAGWVAVVKSYPVVDLEATLTPSVKRLDITANNFTVSACLWYSSQARRDQLQVILARISLKVEPTMRRAVFVTMSQESSTLDEIVTLDTSAQCWNYSINLKGNLYHVTQPIEMTMHYKLVDSASINRDKSFCKGCPVMDPHKSTTVQVKVPFSHGCGENRECRTDLRVDVRASNKGAPLVLGQDTTLSVDVMVWPQGDPAYLAKLSVALSPQEMRLLKLPSNCYQEEASPNTQELTVCSLGHPLVADNKPVTTHFEVDLSGVTLETVKLVFNMTAWSVSEELTPGDNSKILEIPVERVSNVVIKGNQIQRHILLSGKEEINKTEIRVNHEYEILNFGPSPVHTVHIDFRVPVVLDKDGSKPEFFAHISDTYVMVDNNLLPCRMDDSALPENTPWTPSDDFSEFELEQVPPEEEELGARPEHHLSGGRRRRDVSSATSQALVANSTDSFKRALYLNSSNAETASVWVDCETGPLPAHGRALVKLNLYINKTHLAHLLTSFDAVVIATDGRLTGSDATSSTDPMEERMREATVETVILGEVPKDEIDSRILALSIAVGLLLLLPLFKGLSLCGFFNRGDKEKLAMLKERVQAEAEFEIDDDGY